MLACNPDRVERRETNTQKCTGTAQADAARGIERSLRDELGPEAFAALARLLGALGSTEQPRMRDYLRSVLGRGGGLE